MDRIPEGSPLVVYPSAKRLGTYYGLFIALVVALPICVVLGFLAAEGFDGRAVLFLAVLFAPFVLVGVGSMLWRLVAELRSGPTLAADGDGLWIHARKWPVRPQRLRWDEIDWIAVRRYGVDRSVSVMPRAEPLAPGQDQRERNQMRRQMRDYGALYTASLTWGDRPEQEVMAQLHHLAAGRCQVVTG